MIILYLLLLMSCRRSTFVRSKFIYRDNRYILLSRKLYPGRYYLKGSINKRKKIGYFKIDSARPHWSNGIRNMIRDRIFINTLYLDYKKRSIILAIVLGESVDKSLKSIYSLGLGHYLAISGFHFSILSTIIQLTFKNNIVLLLISSLYLLINFSPSVLRSYLAILFITLSIFLGEERAKKKEFITSLLLSILIFGIKPISLQLTFTAAATFVLFPKRSFLFYSITIPILMAIPSLYFFKNFNLLSPLLSIISYPLIYTITILSFLSVIIPIPTYLIGSLISIFIKILDLCSPLSKMLTIHYSIPTFLIILFYISLLSGIIFLNKEQ